MQLNPALVSSALLALIAVILGLNVVRNIVFDGADPYRCNALLNSGLFIDGPEQFKNWQPNGCMLHSYQKKDIAACLSDRRVVFIGDSTTRQLYYSFLRTVDPGAPDPFSTSDPTEKHSDKTHSAPSGLSLSFHWDPYLNTSRTADLISSPVSLSTRPALLVLGTGLWYLRNSAESGGLTTWTERVDWAFSKLSDPARKVADEVVFLPVEDPFEPKLSADRARTIHTTDVHAMNADLAARLHPHPDISAMGSLLVGADGVPGGAAPRPDLEIPFVFNDVIALGQSQTADGLHYGHSVLRYQAQILLNHRCNEVLPKRFPLDKTCCRRYPSFTGVQLAFLLFIVFWAPLGKVFHNRLASRPRLAMLFPKEEILAPLTIFGSAIGILYLADRTHVFLKEHKQYEPTTFAFLSLVALAAGLGTMKKGDKDLGFLNRDQTDEWKGWMQIAILIYHYLGASKISGIYNPIRVLVAAYLFMTGLGHFTFYYKKADFGFARIANVLVRLNLLTVVLAYVMNTDYISYYFSPLVSLWFLIIWGTMYAGHKYNERLAFLLAKLVVSAALVTYLISTPPYFETLFWALERVFHIRWSATEWRFRVALDMWIVYAGMLVALASLKFRELRIADRPWWPKARQASVALAAVTLAGFMWFELSQPSKFTYNAWHPYVSVLPVLAFIILRNATTALRSTSSKVFCWIGQCSLETFILQFHVWLAADTKGILLVIPGTSLRPINFLISSAIFLFLSHKVATATGYLTEWICGGGKKRLPVTAVPPSAPALPLMQQIEVVPATAGSSAAQQPIERISLALESEKPSTVDVEAANASAKAAGWTPGWRQRTVLDWARIAGTSIGKDLRLKLAVGLLVLWILNLASPALS